MNDLNYPVLEIDTEKAYVNALTVRRLCLENQIEPTAVIKGFNAIDSVTGAICRAGFKRLASSRLCHLKQAKERHNAETMALRIPMLCEVRELVSCADISLNSEYGTLAELNAEADRQGKVHKVILMRDLGDLREGIWDREQLYKTALRVENELPNLRLCGIGANLSCYGSVLPTGENLGELADDSREIEQRLGHSLEIVSGGGTSSFALLLKNGIPPGINDLRIGEALAVPRVFSDYWKCCVPELSNRIFILKAQIIECGEKPTMPKGVLGTDGFGNYKTYEDRGWRRRALLALGVFDIGDYGKLLPVDPDLKILGGSSDHLIVDIQDSRRDYRLGDIVEFELSYLSMLYATASPLIQKIEL